MMMIMSAGSIINVLKKLFRNIYEFTSVFVCRTVLANLGTWLPNSLYLIEYETRLLEVIVFGNFKVGNYIKQNNSKEHSIR